MLKIVGRDKYLTYSHNYHVIVRQCFRNDEVDTFLEFALIFVPFKQGFLNMHANSYNDERFECYQSNYGINIALNNVHATSSASNSSSNDNRSSGIIINNIDYNSTQARYGNHCNQLPLDMPSPHSLNDNVPSSPQQQSQLLSPHSNHSGGSNDRNSNYNSSGNSSNGSGNGSHSDPQVNTVAYI